MTNRLNLKYLSEQTGVPTKNMTDGYHSFSELYEWRHLLFTLALKFNYEFDGVPEEGYRTYTAWWTDKHHPENKPMFEIEGQPAILVGIELPGMSVQFHMPMRYKNAIAKQTEYREHGPFYDGSNNPEAALQYLKDFLRL